MASSTKTEFQSTVYTEPGRTEARRTSAGKKEEPESGPIIAPGIDQFFELFYQYGLHMLVAVMTYLSFWIIWAVDFSGGH